MKKYIFALGFVFLAATAATPTTVSAQTSNITELLAVLQDLMRQVEVLQKQLAEVRGEINEELKSGLVEGMEDEDIKEIQELLATDPTIYPRGIVSGYYGPLTTEAIKRFQERHELPVTGQIDEATKEMLQEYFKERSNGKFPVGLLRAPGIQKKMLDRWRERDDKWEVDCEDKRGAGPLCKRDKEDKYDDEDEDEDDNYEDDKDEDDDKDDDSSVSSTTAATAINDAQTAIDDLAEAIASVGTSTDEEAVADAEDELAEAEELLDKAEADLAGDDYESAYENAKDAENKAEKALKDLE